MYSIGLITVTSCLQVFTHTKTCIFVFLCRSIYLKMTYLQRLPMEILLHICSFLAFSEIGLLTRTSQHFYKCLSDPQIWRKYIISPERLKILGFLELRNTPRFSGIESLIFSYKHKFKTSKMVANNNPVSYTHLTLPTKA